MEVIGTTSESGMKNIRGFLSLTLACNPKRIPEIFAVLSYDLPLQLSIF